MSSQVLPTRSPVTCFHQIHQLLQEIASRYLTQPVKATESSIVTGGPLPIGSQIPSVELDCGFPPEKVNLAERTKGKRVIIVGLPGAFTPT